MKLNEALDSMQKLLDIVQKATEKKFADAESVKSLLKGLEKAKDAKDFEKKKRECQTAIKKLDEDLVLEELKVSNAGDQVKAAKDALGADRKIFEKTKGEYENNLKKCQLYNQNVKKFNKDLDDRKKRGEVVKDKPRPLIPELEVAKVMKEPAEALDAADYAIGDTENYLKLAERQEKRDGEQVKRYQKELDDKEFTPPAKGKGR